MVLGSSSRTAARAPATQAELSRVDGRLLDALHDGRRRDDQVFGEAPLEEGAEAEASAAANTAATPTQAKPATKKVSAAKAPAAEPATSKAPAANAAPAPSATEAAGTEMEKQAPQKPAASKPQIAPVKPAAKADPAPNTGKNDGKGQVRKLLMPQKKATVLGRIELPQETIRDATRRSAPAAPPDLRRPARQRLPHRQLRDQANLDEPLS